MASTSDRTPWASALGLAGDATDVEPLLAALRNKKSSLYVQGAMTTALARLGTVKSVDRLIAMANDETVQDLNRGMAVATLGLLSDLGEEPVLGRLAPDTNYRAQCNLLEELLSGL